MCVKYLILYTVGGHAIPDRKLARLHQLGIALRNVAHGAPDTLNQELRRLHIASQSNLNYGAIPAIPSETQWQEFYGTHNDPL
jgi:acetylglutamate kinase